MKTMEHTVMAVQGEMGKKGGEGEAVRDKSESSIIYV